MVSASRPLGAASGAAELHPLAGLFAEPGRARQRWTVRQGRELLLLEHRLFQAAFSRQGAQLLHFQPRGQRPWLWCAGHWPQGAAIRGGVPICWPWFGRHPSESGWPSHGWARLSEEWQLLVCDWGEQGVQLLWQLELCDWTLRLEAELGETLALRLVTRHQDSEPCQLSHALHAYWRISDVSLVETRERLDYQSAASLEAPPFWPSSIGAETTPGLIEALLDAEQASGADALASERANDRTSVRADTSSDSTPDRARAGGLRSHEPMRPPSPVLQGRAQ